jgi:hypothetical protein
MPYHYRRFLLIRFQPVGRAGSYSCYVIYGIFFGDNGTPSIRPELDLAHPLFILGWQK